MKQFILTFMVLCGCVFMADGADKAANNIEQVIPKWNDQQELKYAQMSQFLWSTRKSYDDEASSEPISPEQELLERQAFSSMDCIPGMYSRGDSRKKVAEQYMQIYQKYPNTKSGREAEELGRLLLEMVQEDEKYQKPQDPNEQELIADYIYRFRDECPIIFNTVPGSIKVLDGAFKRLNENEDFAIIHLQKMGAKAIPAMIETLTDRRPTRLIEDSMNGGATVRNCDLALEVIEDYAGRKFYDEPGSGKHLSGASKQVKAKVITDVKQWWATEQKKDKQPS